MSAPRTLAEMPEIEQRWMRAWHEITCEDEPVHQIEEHEPFEEDASTAYTPWPEFEAVFRKHGIAMTMVPPEGLH